MKLIEKTQLVGLTAGFAVFRDLYEDEDGNRHSVRTSHTFDMQQERKLGKPYPPQAEIFEKHKLPTP